MFQEQSVQCEGVSMTQPLPLVRAGSGSGKTMQVRGRPTTWRWPSPSRAPTTASSNASTWHHLASATSLIFRTWHRCVEIPHVERNSLKLLGYFFYLWLLSCSILLMLGLPSNWECEKYVFSSSCRWTDRARSVGGSRDVRTWSTL